MAATRVFLFLNHLIFTRGLENLLSQDFNFEIVGQETEVQDAVEQIQRLHPDVVIMDVNDAEDNPRLSCVLEQVEHPMKVIGLSLSDNKLYIYQITQCPVNQVEDLSIAIEETTLTRPIGLS